MTVAQPTRIPLIAVVVATFAALIGRAWLQVELLANDVATDFAADISYLVVPPILFVLLFPVLRQHGAFLRSLLDRRSLTTRLVCNAIAIGLLLRLSAWGHLIAGVSFGVYESVGPAVANGPSFSFNCAEPRFVVLGVVVMVLIVPFIEELVHRGLIQSWLSNLGPVVAVLMSSLLFMLVHRQSTWGFAFYAGLVLGIQFWQTKTIWFSLITHATVNGLIQVDWRCLHGHWNPPATQVPVWSVGLISVLILLLSSLALMYLLLGKSAGVQDAPRH